MPTLQQYHNIGYDKNYNVGYGDYNVGYDTDCRLWQIIKRM